MGEKVGEKLGEKVGEKTGEKVEESLGEIHKLNLCQNTQCFLVQSLGFQHFRHNLYNQKPKLIAIFSSNYSLELYLPKFLGPCDFWPFFLVNVFQKKSLLLRKGLKKSLSKKNLVSKNLKFWNFFFQLKKIFVSQY